MYAIFRAAGKQFKAEKGKTLRLPLMSAEAGSKITFDEVLLSSDGETIKAGVPLMKGAKVVAEVVGEGKEPKIYVFKFKRRKNSAGRPATGRNSPKSASPTSSWVEGIWHTKRA